MSIKNAADLFYSYKFLKALTTRWEKTDAFKLGIIDKNGKKLKDPETKAEKESYTVFNRLVFNIKRLLPNNILASYAVALVLLRENNDQENIELQYEEYIRGTELEEEINKVIEESGYPKYKDQFTAIRSKLVSVKNQK